MGRALRSLPMFAVVPCGSCVTRVPVDFTLCLSIMLWRRGASLNLISRAVCCVDTLSVCTCLSALRVPSLPPLQARCQPTQYLSLIVGRRVQHPLRLLFFILSLIPFVLGVSPIVRGCITHGLCCLSLVPYTYTYIHRCVLSASVQVSLLTHAAPPSSAHASHPHRIDAI